MPYLFDDEDNVPMVYYPWDVDYNPTVYMSRAQEKAEESLPFSDPKPDDGCWNCELFDDGKCMKEWNNLDPSYYISDRDDRSENEYCGDWERRDDHIGNNP